MTKHLTLLRLVAIALIIVVIGALLGWYYFLHGKNAQTNANDNAAGYGATAPTFEGSAGSTYANVVSTLGIESGTTATTSTSRLWEVSAVPVAGYSWQKSAVPALDFVERSSGYVFSAQTSGRSVTRLTDTLRPKIYEALVTLDGSVVERSIDDSGTLITFAGSVASSSPAQIVPSSTSTSAADLVGNDLSNGIQTIAADPASDTLFYTIPGPSGISLVSTDLAGAKEKQLFSSAIAGWRLFAPGDGSVVLLQNPLDGVTGYAYRISKNGTFSLIAQAPGLTVLPNGSSNALLFGSSSNGQLSLFMQSSASASPMYLSIQTVADKCAWAPGQSLIAYCGAPQNVTSQQFLDDWYKGILHTSDKFYEIDASTASTTLIYDPSDDTSAQFDVEDMSVDPSGQFIAFINARDMSLWVLRIAP
jgi:hypothetical protein